MKYHFAFLFCLVSISIFAQTSYQDFIQQDDSIQWAAEYNPLMAITPKVKKFRIREILFQQQIRNGFINNYRISNDSIIKFKFYKGDNSLAKNSIITLENIYQTQYEWGAYLDDYNPFINDEKKCSCNNNTSSNRIDVYKLKQILYYQNSNLYIKNILVTPLCLKEITGWQQFIWQSSFSSCYNNSNNRLITKQKKGYVDLGNSVQVYNPLYFGDSSYDPRIVNTATNIFGFGNPALASNLFEDIFDNKITAVDDSNNIISPEKILQYKNPPLEIPTYDTAGNLSGSKMIQPELNVDSFYRYKIYQHFYFDTANDILYSEVNYIDLLRYEFDSIENSFRDAVYCRIYFIKPSLYKKAIRHRFLNN
jgi:hypothetical protein